jgi:hypothetical protein
MEPSISTENAITEESAAFAAVVIVVVFVMIC